MKEKISTEIDTEVIKLLKEYCKENGYKIGAVIEQAILLRIKPE